MIKTTFLLIAFTTSTLASAKGPLVTNNLPPINYVHRQNAVYAFQANHQRACSLVPEVCNLPTLQMDTPHFSDLDKPIREGLSNAIRALGTEADQSPSHSARAKAIEAKREELLDLRLSIQTQSYLFSLSFLNVYEK